MASIGDTIFSVFIFLSIYAQVFFLVTFLENRKKIVTRSGRMELSKYPSVTVAVPCWNEEQTVERTVNSLLNLNYQKIKFKFLLSMMGLPTIHGVSFKNLLHIQT